MGSDFHKAEFMDIFLLLGAFRSAPLLKTQTMKFDWKKIDWQLSPHEDHICILDDYVLRVEQNQVGYWHYQVTHKDECILRKFGEPEKEKAIKACENAVLMNEGDFVVPIALIPPRQL